MRCGWGPYFRRTFEVQAGNSPLQGQSKPPAKLVVLILMILQNRIIGKFQRDSLNLVRIFVAGRRNDCYTEWWNRAEER